MIINTLFLYVIYTGLLSIRKIVKSGVGIMVHKYMLRVDCDSESCMTAMTEMWYFPVHQFDLSYHYLSVPACLSVCLSVWLCVSVKLADPTLNWWLRSSQSNPRSGSERLELL